MKKFLVSMLFAMMLVVLMSVTAFAAQEVESNNTAANATSIALNTKVYGNLSSSSDVDWYKFTVSQKGYFYVDFDHELIDSTSRYWEMRLYNSTGQEFIDGNSAYFYWTGKSTSATSIFGVDPGTYYIKINKDNHSTREYNFTVKFAASNIYESENNNTKENADLVEVNQTYHGSLSTNGDVDWYEFTVAQDGYFYFDFNHELLDSTSRYWVVRFYDSTGVNFVDGNDYYFYYTGKSTGPTSLFGIKAGTYYIKLNKDNHSSTPYDFTVNFTASNLWETENNNSKNDADSINVNTTYKGSLSTNGDVDWYKFTLTEKGCFKIDFTHELFDSTSRYWTIRVYDSTGVNFVDGVDSYFYITGKENGGTNTFGVDAGTYYVKITKDNHSALPYDIKVNFTPASNWESENNNSKDTADTITVNKSYSGSLTTNGDTDWYKFTVQSSCEVAITFDHSAIQSSSTYWRIYLYDSSAITQLLSYACKGNVENATTEYISLDSGTYCIKVVKDNHSGINYSLTVHEKHDCSGTFEIAKEPTCTEGGTKEKRCHICDKLLETQPIAAKGHSCTIWTLDKEASCSEKGKRYSVCDDCGTTINEDIPMIAHTMSAWDVTEEPACHKKGERERNCTKCTYNEIEPIDTLPHAYGAWSVTKEPSCYYAGSEKRTCATCGNQDERSIEQLTHIYGNWETVSEPTCYSRGNKEKNCLLCGRIESEQLEQLTHEYGEWEVVSGNKIIPPIVKEKTCTLCNDTETVKDWSNVWITAIAAIVGIGVLIGVGNYIVGLKKGKR